MVWTKNTLLEDLGLAPQNHKPYTKKKLHIDKGEIDPRSLGGLALVSRSQFDDRGALENLELGYWVIHPDGRYEKQHLVQLETERVKGGKLDIQSLWILGREISLHDEKNINNVLEAVRRIHVSLRDNSANLPHIAKIFKDCMLEDIIGENLALPGFDLEQRIYFPAIANFNLKAQGASPPTLNIPLEAFLPLSGMRKNTLDVDQDYMRRDFLKTRGVIPQTSKRFEMVSAVRKVGKNKKQQHKLEIRQGPVSDIAANDNRRLLMATHWKVKRASQAKNVAASNQNIRDTQHAAYDIAEVKKINILGTNMLGSGFREAMGALGILNRTHADMMHARDYPCMQDHLATYGALDVAQSSSNPPNKDGRLVLTSIGGNNLREIYPGIGKDIGGNCKTIENHWLDPKTGETRKLGAILDFGTYLIKTQSEWSAGHPDVVEKLKYCKDIFITHHHLDHIDALVPYIKRGLLSKEHTVYITPEVFEMAHDKLTKMGIKRDDPRRPNFHLLQGTDVIDLKDEKGIKRMSVMFGVDAVPHSAKDTPFIAYGREDDRILGSYMYLGDMRYDENWLEMHDSPFWDPVKIMRAREPDLNPEHLMPTYTEIDGTSVKREGRGANEKDVENNLTEILKDWFPDKHAGMAIIGTNDGRREGLLRVANNTGRKMTGFGAAVEFLFRIANKHGVNPYLVNRPETGKYTGIKDFLQWHAEENGLEQPTEYKSRTSKAVKSWFEEDEPGSIVAVMSGSQGNPVEFESMTYKLADGRSFLDADPKTLKTARPADLKDWVIIFTQGAIPGNGKYQRALIKRLALRGAIVLESFDDNLRVHNPGKLKERILADMVKKGRLAEGREHEAIEADGSIFVENMSIHSSGHGRKGDMELWLQKLQAKFFGLHHTDNRETVMSGYDTIEKMGKAHPGDIFNNGVEVEITNDSVTPIGKTISSIILTREKQEEGKHYNKQLEATRVLNFDDRSPHSELGLRGSVGGPFEMHFGVEDAEDVRKRVQAMENKDGVEMQRSEETTAKPRRLYQGMDAIIAPSWDPDNLLLEP